MSAEKLSLEQVLEIVENGERDQKVDAVMSFVYQTESSRVNKLFECLPVATPFTASAAFLRCAFMLRRRAPAWYTYRDKVHNALLAATDLEREGRSAAHIMRGLLGVQPLPEPSMDSKQIEQPQEIETIKEKIRGVMKYFRNSIEAAQQEGKPALAVIARHEDGGGRIVMSFECEEFFADLAKLVDAPEDTLEDMTEAKALEFRQRLDAAGIIIHKTEVGK